MAVTPCNELGYLRERHPCDMSSAANKDRLVYRMNVELFKATADHRHNINEVTSASFFSANGFLIVDCQPQSTISLQPGLAGLWSPIHGQTLLTSADSKALVTKRCIYASDSQRHVSVALGAKSRCIGVIATQSAWSSLVAPWEPVSQSEHAVFPALHLATPTTRRSIIRCVREAMNHVTNPQQNDSLTLLASTLHELQSDFSELIDRCPGHSVAKRRAVFLRLQRAKNYILLCPRRDFNVGILALVANYSIWRFIKVFYMVYGNTPYAYMSQSRAEHAGRLLQNSSLAVGDVGIAAGFDSRSSFTRVIKKHLGQPAREIRRAAADLEQVTRRQ